MHRSFLWLCVVALSLAGCSRAGGGTAEVAEAYVKLALDLEWRDPGSVDAYFGPARWREEAAEGDRSLPILRAEADSLLRRLRALRPADEAARLRHRHLEERLRSIVARIDLLAGETMTFDEESRALFGATAPPVSEAELRPVLEEIEGLLPGPGPLVERYRSLREGLTIPRDRLDAVLQAALRGCRDETLRHLSLPAGEQVRIEYVTRRPWLAYHRYLGGYRSVIEVSTDYRVTLDDVLDIACHEGYPGHHVHAVLMERDLVVGRGWIEHSLIPLYSPQAFVAEGTAQLAIDMAFPGERRVRFEREVLLPLAGIPPGALEPYPRVRPLVKRLAPAVDEAARRYLDGEMDRPSAAAWLETHALAPAPEAILGFVNRYRTYLITYNAGEAAARRFVDSGGGAADQPELRWRRYGLLLASPSLPVDLGPHDPPADR